jgi:hypothetical protein
MRLWGDFAAVSLPPPVPKFIAIAGRCAWAVFSVDPVGGNCSAPDMTDAKFTLLAGCLFNVESDISGLSDICSPTYIGVKLVNVLPDLRRNR